MYNMRKCILIVCVGIFLSFLACTSQKQQNINDVITLDSLKSIPLTIAIQTGKSFNNPSFAIWIEDMNEQILSTIFVTKSVATNYFGHAYSKNNVWLPDSGISIRPATLPYWLHKQTGGNITAVNLQNPIVPDALSGATPKGSVTIYSSIPETFPHKIKVCLEINQAWDWNQFYTNSKYPNSFEYKTSAQPSVIYAVNVDVTSKNTIYYMNPIGHGHFAGENGELYTDLRGHTSALQIVDFISVTLK